jgi:hypothetical protein
MSYLKKEEKRILEQLSIFLAKDFDKVKDDYLQVILDVFKEEGDNSY